MLTFGSSSCLLLSSVWAIVCTIVLISSRHFDLISFTEAVCRLVCCSRWLMSWKPATPALFSSSWTSLSFTVRLFGAGEPKCALKYWIESVTKRGFFWFESKLRTLYRSGRSKRSSFDLTLSLEICAGAAWASSLVTSKSGLISICLSNLTWSSFWGALEDVARLRPCLNACEIHRETPRNHGRDCNNRSHSSFEVKSLSRSVAL